MIVFFGEDQGIKAAGRIVVIADAASNIEPVKLGVKCEAGGMGWFAPFVAADRAGRCMWVKA